MNIKWIILTIFQWIILIPQNICFFNINVHIKHISIIQKHVHVREILNFYNRGMLYFDYYMHLHLYPKKLLSLLTFNIYLMRTYRLHEKSICMQVLNAQYVFPVILSEFLMFWWFFCVCAWMKFSVLMYTLCFRPLKFIVEIKNTLCRVFLLSE